MHRSRSFTPFSASGLPRAAAWLAVLITGAFALAQQTVPPTAPPAVKPRAPAEALDQRIIAGARSSSEVMTNDKRFRRRCRLFLGVRLQNLVQFLDPHPFGVHPA